jgi:hypothetical protein
MVRYQLSCRHPDPVEEAEAAGKIRSEATVAGMIPEQRRVDVDYWSDERETW